MNMDNVLKVRAEERFGSAMNSGDALVTFIIDAIALKSKSKRFKTFAFIWTMINVADKIRMIIANINARNQAIEFIEDEDEKELAKECSTLNGFMAGIKTNGILYQFTGKVS